MAQPPWFHSASLVLLVSVSSALGCAGSVSKNGVPTGGAGSSAAGSGTSAGAAGSGSGVAGSGTSSGAAGATAGAAGTAGASGTTGVAGGAAGATGAAGASGAAGAAGTSGAAGTTSLPDPGTDGDGDFVIGPTFKIDPASNYVQGTPIGRQFAFVMNSADSKIYPGRNGTPYMRHVWVYVPMQYVAGTPAPFIAVQDGNYAVWFGNDVPHAVNTGSNLPGTANLPRILDNYIAAKKLPKLVVIFAEAGGGDGGSSERGLEYDTVSGKYAEYMDTEVLPRVVTEAQAQLKLDLAFTKDPQGRGTLGGSSGGAGSFSMAWWHPDLFTRVITYSGTFVRQASPEDPLYPHGCWCYHDFDPYDAAMPNGLIVMEANKKPIRHWLEVGTNDMGSGSGPSSYRDFQLANQRMAASYKAKGYHYHFDLAQGGGHLDGGAVAQTLPAALLYVWRGYPIE
jgi:enterochelin esterase family protein